MNTHAPSPAAKNARAKRPAHVRGLDGCAATEYLSAAQAAELLGVSLRKFVDLRHAGWMPLPVELGPRCLRWRRAELIEAIDTRVQRAAIKPVDAHLVVGQKAARARRAPAAQEATE